MNFIIVITAVEKQKDAKDLARKIIKARLGACIHISKIKSFYKWKGKIENAKEYKLEIKTLSKNYQKLKELIIKNHKYELPEIIVIKIERGYDKYLNWIEKNSNN